MNRFPLIAAASIAVALALTACSAGRPADTGKTPESSPVAATPASPGPSASAGSEFGASAKSSRGNLLKEIGQIAGTTSSATNAVTSRFTVTDITMDIPCTSRFQSPPKNGHYVGIHLNVETTPELAQDPYPSLSFTPFEWQAYDAEGKRLNDPQGNAYSCLDQGELLPSQIGPGQSVSGWIVLDVASTSGTLVFAMAGGPTGWEWKY